MQESPLYHSFKALSRVFIILPILCVILGVYVKLNASKNAYVPMPTPTPAIAPTAAPTKVKVQLDLNGPYACEGHTQDSTASAYIQKQKIAIVIQDKTTTDHMVVNGDCFYEWDNPKTGSKVCNITPYLELFNVMSSMHAVDSGAILKVVPKMTETKVDTTLFTNTLAACQKTTVNDSVFAVPKTVVFTQKQAPAQLPKIQQ